MFVARVEIPSPDKGTCLNWSIAFLSPKAAAIATAQLWIKFALLKYVSVRPISEATTYKTAIHYALSFKHSVTLWDMSHKTASETHKIQDTKNEEKGWKSKV